VLQLVHARRDVARWRPLRLVERGRVARGASRGDRNQDRARAHSQPARFGGYFSPASIFALRMFCFGGSGQVVYSLNAHGGL